MMALHRPQGSEVDVLSVADGCMQITDAHNKRLHGQLSVEALFESRFFFFFFPFKSGTHMKTHTRNLASSVLKWDRDLPQTG